jgi:hypothetical protein
VDAHYPVSDQMALALKDDHISPPYASAAVSDQCAVSILDQGEHAVARYRDNVLLPHLTPQI